MALASLDVEQRGCARTPSVAAAVHVVKGRPPYANIAGRQRKPSGTTCPLVASATSLHRKLRTDSDRRSPRLRPLLGRCVVTGMKR